MSLRVYNSLTNAVEPFEPREPGKVRMYHCGPTVYGDQHIGNYRTFLFSDVLRRYLEYRGFEVLQVMNLTDVGHLTQDDIDSGEDKIIKKARELGWDPLKVAEHYAERFFRDRRTLGFLDAHHFPRATAHVPEMIELIEKLLTEGIAYRVESGNIYFDVTKFEDYGKLSGNTLDRVRAGARVEVNPEKRHPADFALWKRDEKHLMQFDSPWGKGFPGWHIECSAMARKYLGDTLDIHTGGEDNIFPHHECEIAQSEAVTGKPFARYWLHPRFLLFEGEKVAKSKGTALTIGYLVEQGYDPMAIRYALVSVHYRQQVRLDLQKEGNRVRLRALDDATKALERLRGVRRRLQETAGEGAGEAAPFVRDLLERAREGFEGAMDDDLNASGAFSVLHDLARDLNRAMDEGRLEAAGAAAALGQLDAFDSVFGVLGGEVPSEEIPAEVTDLVRQREEARKTRDFAASDALRDRIRELGWLVEDSKDGAKLKPVR